MSNTARLTIASLAAWLTGCGCSSENSGLGYQQIYGKAILAAQPSTDSKSIVPSLYDNSAFEVCGWCNGDETCECTSDAPNPQVAPDGSYTLYQFAMGPNEYRAVAPSTLEGAAYFTVDGCGDVEAPTVTLTPLGSVTGTVTGLPELAGVVVTVDDTSDVTITDATGGFTIVGLLSGTHGLTALEPGSTNTSRATVQVPYNTAASVMIAFAAK